MIGLWMQRFFAPSKLEAELKSAEQERQERQCELQAEIERVVTGHVARRGARDE